MSQGRETSHGRLDALWILFVAAAALLGGRLLQMQVLQGGYYAQAAERNRTQVIRQTAPRGRILDRNGAIVADNQAVFSLVFLPGKNKDMAGLTALAEDLAPHLGASPEDLLRSLLKAIREESAIRLAEKLPPPVMFKLSELRPIYPGITLIVEARRYYPLGAFAAHLLGYLGKMDENGWARLKRQGYRVDSWVGRSGIEKQFEAELRGQDGGVRMEVDARGRLKRVLAPVPWKAGSNLRLTLDAGIQGIAEDALRRSASGRGAAVVIDPGNGDVLALASIPDYDPNAILAAPLPGERGAKRPTEPYGEEVPPPKSVGKRPEFNLALQGSYPPGSVFKIITSAALLGEGRVLPRERVFCPGHFEVGRRVFLCWEQKGHRFQDWLGGITHSCDVYFYRMGLRVGADAIERYGRMFRLGAETHLGLPGESSGHLFGPAARRRRGGSWFDGDTANLSIGQGELLVTPIQMAGMIAAVANRGTLWRPHFIRSVEYSDGRPAVHVRPEELGRIPLNESAWDMLQAGLENVVREGTGRGVHIPGLVIGGKTGTAQNPHGKDHSWFVCYARRSKAEPGLAVAVLVQHGGHGSEAAVPVARRILLQAFGVASARLERTPEWIPAPTQEGLPALAPTRPVPMAGH